ncbi:hypothetical protein LOAG_14100, partial [Loa loa]
NLNNAENILTLRMVLQSSMPLVNKDIASNLLKYDKKLGKNKMCFEWFNSRFVDALVNGYWILIENFNCCSVFFTIYDDYGSVSRAVCNRSVELYLLMNELGSN